MTARPYGRGTRAVELAARAHRWCCFLHIISTAGCASFARGFSAYGCAEFSPVEFSMGGVVEPEAIGAGGAGGLRVEDTSECLVRRLAHLGITVCHVFDSNASTSMVC